MDYYQAKVKSDARAIKKLCKYLRRLRIRSHEQRVEELKQLAASWYDLYFVVHC